MSQERSTLLLYHCSNLFSPCKTSCQVFSTRSNCCEFLAYDGVILHCDHQLNILIVIFPVLCFSFVSFTVYTKFSSIFPNILLLYQSFKPYFTFNHRLSKIFHYFDFNKKRKKYLTTHTVHKAFGNSKQRSMKLERKRILRNFATLLLKIRSLKTNSKKKY